MTAPRNAPREPLPMPRVVKAVQFTRTPLGRGLTLFFEWDQIILGAKVGDVEWSDGVKGTIVTLFIGPLVMEVVV
jgi:hypothetical protein